MRLQRAWPASEPSPKKSPSANMPIVTSLPVVEITAKFHLARWDIKHRISEIALDEDALFLRESTNLLPSATIQHVDEQTLASRFSATVGKGSIS